MGNDDSKYCSKNRFCSKKVTEQYWSEIEQTLNYCFLLNIIYSVKSRVNGLKAATHDPRDISNFVTNLTHDQSTHDQL